MSDRWLGARRSVILGCSIMAAGHFIMMSEAVFYPALAAICFGNGLFLLNLLSQAVLVLRPARRVNVATGDHRLAGNN